MKMQLKVLLPSEILLQRPVLKVIAEGQDGSFCLLPRHVDFLAVLVPGILTYHDPDGRDHYVAVDAGILVKQAGVVLVSTRQAVAGPNIQSLRETVHHKFRLIDERERSARSAVARLESDLIRRFLELDEATL